MTVYLCLTGCIFLFFGVVGVFLSPSVTLKLLWGALLLAGALIIAAAIAFRPGVNTRTLKKTIDGSSFPVKVNQ